MTIESERELFMGCDPGLSGGMAIVDRNGDVVDASAMPDTERDLFDYIAEFAPRLRMAFVEKVASAPGQGVRAMFTFGRNYGSLRMALIACKVPFDEVPPMTWQTAMCCVIRGRKRVDENKTEKKNRNKARAQQLFPAQRITHAIADALLIAEHCRRSNGGASALRQLSLSQMVTAYDDDPKSLTKVGL